MDLHSTRPSRVRWGTLGPISSLALTLTLWVLATPGLAAAAVSRAGGAELTLAYLDPGTGSFIIQAVVAGIAGAAVTLRLYWGKIRALFGGSAPEVDAAEDE